MHGDDGRNEKLRGLNMEINALVMEVGPCLQYCLDRHGPQCFSLHQLEQLGAMGRVEEAQSLMRRVEDLERERERERTVMSASEPKVSANSTFDLCSVEIENVLVM